MKRIIDILSQWHFQEKSEGHWYKFITPDSYVSFIIKEDNVRIVHRVLCGNVNEERIKFQTTYTQDMDKLRIISTMFGLKEFLKHTIIDLVTDLHYEYLFKEKKEEFAV